MKRRAWLAMCLALVLLLGTVTAAAVPMEPEAFVPEELEIFTTCGVCGDHAPGDRTGFHLG